MSRVLFAGNLGEEVVRCNAWQWWWGGGVAHAYVHARVRVQHPLPDGVLTPLLHVGHTLFFLRDVGHIMAFSREGFGATKERPAQKPRRIRM